MLPTSQPESPVEEQLMAMLQPSLFNLSSLNPGFQREAQGSLDEKQLGYGCLATPSSTSTPAVHNVNITTPSTGNQCGSDKELSPAANSAEISLTLATSKIYRFKSEELWIELPRAWRLSHNMTESDVFQAGLAAKCCKQGSPQEAICAKCLFKKVVSISVTSLHPFYRATTDVEKYILLVKSICTSSRDHLKAPLVISVDLPNHPEPLYSNPFHILSRCYKKGPSSATSPIISAPTKETKQTQTALKIVKPPPILGVNPDINYIPSAISVVVRLVLVYLTDEQTALIFSPVQKLLADYPGFLAIKYNPVGGPLILDSNNPTSKAKVWVTVAVFRSIQDAISGLSFYIDYAENRTKNPLDCNLDAMGLTKSVAIVTNF
ncbi:hypothetical protein Pelo_3929 [Pelomyxa schiedti]|nr:hypothetical protein Pelo_3929 [Pelomyxa schiedti]